MRFVITINNQSVEMTLAKLKKLIRQRKAEGAKFVQNHERDSELTSNLGSNWYIEAECKGKALSYNCFIRLIA